MNLVFFFRRCVFKTKEENSWKVNKSRNGHSNIKFWRFVTRLKIFSMTKQIDFLVYICEMWSTNPQESLISNGAKQLILIVDLDRHLKFIFSLKICAMIEDIFSNETDPQLLFFCWWASFGPQIEDVECFIFSDEVIVLMKFSCLYISLGALKKFPLSEWEFHCQIGNYWRELQPI